MKARILGAGFYGLHIATVLRREGIDVEIHEIAEKIFAGASGNIPARLHLGAPHYPRSFATREACTRHNAEFMSEYGHLTSGVPINIYAIAKDRSLIDFGTYCQVLKNHIEFLTIHDPAEYGLRNVEGAVMVGERHIVTDAAAAHFWEALGDCIKLGVKPTDHDASEYDWTIDCTFSAQTNIGVDRYEPCLVLLLQAPPSMAVTVMDGPFPSLYPWNPETGVCSLSSARYTPFSKECKTWKEAKQLLAGMSREAIGFQAQAMVDSMAEFYPPVATYPIVDYRLSIRAMPLSGADTRLIDIHQDEGNIVRVRAGKIDAIVEAAREVLEVIS